MDAGKEIRLIRGCIYISRHSHSLTHSSHNDMTIHGIIDKYTTAPASVASTNRSLTNSQEQSARMAELNYLTNEAPLPATGVLGFTELLEELEAIGRLPQHQQPARLQELSQRKGQSIARLCHIAAVQKLYGGAA